MNFWQLYWITRIDSIDAFLSIVCVMLSILIGVFLFEEIKIKRLILMCSIMLLILLVKVFIPTTKDILTIYSAQWATNSPEVKKMPDNVVKAINHLLEDYILKETEDDER